MRIPFGPGASDSTLAGIPSYVVPLWSTGPRLCRLSWGPLGGETYAEARSSARIVLVALTNDSGPRDNLAVTIHATFARIIMRVKKPSMRCIGGLRISWPTRQSACGVHHDEGICSQGYRRSALDGSPGLRAHEPRRDDRLCANSISRTPIDEGRPSPASSAPRSGRLDCEQSRRTFDNKTEVKHIAKTSQKTAARRS